MKQMAECVLVQQYSREERWRRETMSTGRKAIPDQ